MRRRTVSLVAACAGLVGATLLGAPASAAPSCVAQSVRAEHELYGTAWGHDVIAFLATHPDVLEEAGFSRFGDLASFGAAQDRASCPEL